MKKKCVVGLKNIQLSNLTGLKVVLITLKCLINVHGLITVPHCLETKLKHRRMGTFYTANISIGSTWAGHYFSVKITFILV